MNSYPLSSQVLDDLGEKVVDAIRNAVDLMRGDLADYRRLCPAWAAQASERGLAAWLHDRLWSHLAVLLDGVADVVVVDAEPTREFAVGLNYRFRMKRHHVDGDVSTYPTQTALDFLAQDGQLPLSGLDQLHLIGGYRWDRDSRTVGPAVISLRDGRDNVIWEEEIESSSGGDATGGATVPVVPAPPKPTVGGAVKRRSTQEGIAE